MNKQKILLMMVCAIVFCAALLIAYFYYDVEKGTDSNFLLRLISMFRTVKKPDYLPVGIAEDCCEVIKSQLRKYYAEYENSSRKISISDFFNYLVEKWPMDESSVNRFSLEVPRQPYTSKYDFGIFLYLPEKLKSETTIVIGHTTLVKWGDRYVSIVLFLQGNNIIIKNLEGTDLLKVVNDAKINSSKPDFYYWHRRIEYLNKQKSED